MKLFLAIFYAIVVSDLTKGATFFGKYPPGSTHCFSGLKKLALGEKYNPRAETESDPCYQETCEGNETDGLLLEGVSCGVVGFDDDPSGKCKLVVEPGNYPECCPKVKCKDSWD